MSHPLVCVFAQVHDRRTGLRRCHVQPLDSSFLQPFSKEDQRISCSLMRHPFVVNVRFLLACSLMCFMTGHTYLSTQRADLLQEMQVMHQAQFKAEIQAVMVSRPDLVRELLQPGDVTRHAGSAEEEK